MKDIKIKMLLKKSTKGTHVYGNEDSAIPTVYIRRDAFDGEPPAVVELHIEECEKK
jgi:hypothetical protein